jgi:hypothetical protein
MTPTRTGRPHSDAHLWFAVARHALRPLTCIRSEPYGTVCAMAQTDLPTLKLPDACRSWIHAVDPAEVIFGHAIPVNIDWWNRSLTERGLPGGPVTAASSEGEIVSTGDEAITRGHVFAQAAGAADDPARALGLLWHVLAFGSGGKVRHNHQRMDSVAANPDDLAKTLAAAARLSRVSPTEAYGRLYPKDDALIAYLGPAFFTKFLYFAGDGRSDHPCLILDERVAEALHRLCGWKSLDFSGSWPTRTYDRYTSLLSRWQIEESSDEEEIRPDLIERWLFSNGRSASARLAAS